MKDAAAPRRDRAFIIGLAVLFLLLWEWAAHAQLISRLFFPPPSTIVSAFGRAVRSGALWMHFAATLVRLLAGLMVGAVPGLIIGLGLGSSPRARTMLDPIVAFFHPLPKLAVLPLFMIVFGLGEMSRVAVIAAAAFFPMLIAAMSGVRQIPSELFETAEAYGASRFHLFTHVVIPGSLPLLLTGLRLCFNIGLLLSVAVELVTAQHGLGTMIWFAWQTMRIEDLYVALAVLAGLGVAFNSGLGWMTARLVPWHSEREA